MKKSTEKPQVYIRNDWVSACRFHDLGQKEILRVVSERILDAMKEEKGQPVVVFDLDSTLYEVAPRTRFIIKEWVESGHRLPDKVYEALVSLKHEDVCYSLKDTFESVGLSLDDKETFEAWKELKDFWWERFFSSAYLKHDIPYPGAVEFVEHVYFLGAHIVYLTGRDHQKMHAGTMENLRRDGFPLDKKRTEAILKTDRSLTDVEYKRAAAQLILQKGNVVASFENEPQNVVVLFETFPDALHVFMHTVCSDNAAPAINGIYRIKNFQK